MIVYKATNITNGKAYIGITRFSLKKRMSSHKSASKKHNWTFYKAIRKYGWDAFKWEVLRTCESYEELKIAEIEEIKKHNTMHHGGCGYNATAGGDGAVGLHVSDETRARLSIAGKGRIVSQATREKLRDIFKGRKNTWARSGIKRSAETIAKLKANHVGRTGKKNSPEMQDALMAALAAAITKLKHEYAWDIFSKRSLGYSFSKIGKDYGVTASAVFYFCKRIGAPV